MRTTEEESLPTATPLTVRELRGFVPALPGRITIDFEDLIEEALEEEAARIVADMEDGSPIEPDPRLG